MAKGLRLVTSKTAKPRRTYAGEPLECACGSRTTVEVRIGRTIKDGKPTAGQKQLRCAECGKALWG